MSGPLPISDDLCELIGLFTSHRVEFMIVGGHAVSLHGRARFTEDLDVFVNRTQENALRIQAALAEFGVSLADDAVRQLAEDPRAMLVLGNRPNQVEVLNFLDGVEFASAALRTVRAPLGQTEASFIGREDLIATKRATGRAKDLIDLEFLDA